MDPIVTTITAVFSSSGVTAVIMACLQRHWARKDRKDSQGDALTKAVKTLMIDRVRYLGRAYIAAGYITLEDKETLNEMNDAYLGLGGNGHLKPTMDAVNGLPVREEG